jgi:class 3 adenylate cyclase
VRTRPPAKSIRFADDAPHCPRSPAALADDRASNGSNNLFAESATSVPIPLDDNDLKYQVSNSRDQSDNDTSDHEAARVLNRKDLLTEETSTNDSMSAFNNSGRSGDSNRNVGVNTLRLCGHKIKIPFTVWTFIAMIIPIGLVIALCAMTIDGVVQDLHTIDAHTDVVELVGDCVSALMVERDVTGPWIGRGNANDWTQVKKARDIVQPACFDRLSKELRRLASSSERSVDAPQMSLDFDRFNNFLINLSINRVKFDARDYSTRDARAFFTDQIMTRSNVLTRIANRLTDHAREVTFIKMLLETRNYMSLARGVGNTIAIGTVSATLIQEYVIAHALATQYVTNLNGYGTTAQSNSIRAWQRDRDVVQAWFLLNLMANTTSNGAATIQKNYSANWWPNVTVGIDLLEQREREQFEKLRAAEAARRNVMQNGLVAGFGVAACLVAAGLLAFQQTRVRGQLERQVTTVERTRKAVSAFVPRFFLHKMGYTSITQVRTGESTNVALAMLFADIRKFTTVSEGMSCGELFTWVQGYFQRMTAIVETRRGNVNQFMGDALFGVFSTCKDAVMCAVDMQSNVQQLNVQRLCEDKSENVPVEIGVGIHHDVVAMGILGDESRHTCTTISSSVNLASRLEGLTKQLGCMILVSDAVMDQLSEADQQAVRMRKVGPVMVKGSAAQVTVYDVFQTDLRPLQQYKAHTREAFEQIASEVINGQSKKAEILPCSFPVFAFTRQPRITHVYPDDERQVRFVKRNCRSGPCGRCGFATRH